jgi:hypothetical protein
MNKVMKNNKSGIGYNSFVQKKSTNQNKAKQNPMSVEKKNTLLTIAKPHHQLPCQSTQDLLHLMLTMCSNED